MYSCLALGERVVPGIFSSCGRPEAEEPLSAGIVAALAMRLAHRIQDQSVRQLGPFRYSEGLPTPNAGKTGLAPVGAGL